MSRLPSNRAQSFIEYVLIIILFAIAFLSILLILGDDLRQFFVDLLPTWFPDPQEETLFPIKYSYIGYSYFVRALI